MATIDYYLTLISPWAFLGAAEFGQIAKRRGASVNVKPSKYVDVFAKTGGLPLPKRSPERRAYRMMELKRWRARRGIPLVLEPKHFPVDETAAARLVIAAQQQGLDALTLATEIGRSLWVLDQNITDAGVVAAAAARAGLDAAAIRAAGPSDAELDAAWEANTTEAVSRGVFGAPSYVLSSGEIFWGQDRLDFLDAALA